MDANLLVDGMRLTLFTGNGLNGTIACTKGTTRTYVRIYEIVTQSPALAGRANFILHVGQVLVVEIVKS